MRTNIIILVFAMMPLLSCEKLSPKNADAKNDQVSINKNETVDIDILENDKGDGIKINFISQKPNNGSASIKGKEKIEYSPDSNYVGNDDFTYIIKDKYGNESTAFVEITIN